MADRLSQAAPDEALSIPLINSKSVPHATCYGNATRPGRNGLGWPLLQQLKELLEARTFHRHLSKPNRYEKRRTKRSHKRSEEPSDKPQAKPQCHSEATSEATSTATSTHTDKRQAKRRAKRQAKRRAKRQVALSSGKRRISRILTGGFE